MAASLKHYFQTLASRAYGRYLGWYFAEDAKPKQAPYPLKLEHFLAASGLDRHKNQLLMPGHVCLGDNEMEGADDMIAVHLTVSPNTAPATLKLEYRRMRVGSVFGSTNLTIEGVFSHSSAAPPVGNVTGLRRKSSEPQIFLTTAYRRFGFIRDRRDYQELSGETVPALLEETREALEEVSLYSRRKGRHFDL